MEINRDSLMPLYYQLEEIIKEEIDIGRYKPGDRIPSENEFVGLVKVSRNTARQALSDLVSEGILYRVQGKGTFVASKKKFVGLTEALSFSSEFKSNGGHLVTKVILSEEVKESPESLGYLKLKESTEVFRIQRLRLMSEVPVALQTSYVPKFFCPGLLSYDLEKNSLYEILREKFGVSIGYSAESLSCLKAEQYEADLLNVKRGSPIFFLTRKTFTKNGEIVEVTRSFMPGDRCEFSFGKDERVSLELNELVR